MCFCELFAFVSRRGESAFLAVRVRVPGASSSSAWWCPRMPAAAGISKGDSLVDGYIIAAPVVRQRPHLRTPRIYISKRRKEAQVESARALLRVEPWLRVCRQAQERSTVQYSRLRISCHTWLFLLLHLQRLALLSLLCALTATFAFARRCREESPNIWCLFASMPTTERTSVPESLWSVSVRLEAGTHPRYQFSSRLQQHTAHRVL